ncbi:MAG: 4Fe-4S cluster-binding domain-containing protein [Bacteroidales bacterium]|nr:4Fe-4S cluster-binding domain-containing protein [Bacteroidales bacterium]
MQYPEFDSCTICPRNCRAKRNAGKHGYCSSGPGFEIASITLHKGEEPVIGGENGICNVFFYHCNLQCVYCQNFLISCKNSHLKPKIKTLDTIVDEIIAILDKGAESLGFVSPSHMVLQMKAIIDAVNKKGYKPIVVYNTNAYDKVETLRDLENYVDVYLPDFKYMDSSLSLQYSDSEDYPEVAGKAIQEMYRQKGNVLRLNERGIAENGIVIRHLILPGKPENSKEILRYIAREISPRMNVSLMSQYYPIEGKVLFPPLNRKITIYEYKEITKEMELLGMENGWLQEIESPENYLPDFDSSIPFG